MGIFLSQSSRMLLVPPPLTQCSREQLFKMGIFLSQSSRMLLVPPPLDSMFMRATLQNGNFPIPIKQDVISPPPPLTQCSWEQLFKMGIFLSQSSRMLLVPPLDSMFMRATLQNGDFPIPIKQDVISPPSPPLTQCSWEQLFKMGTFLSQSSRMLLVPPPWLNVHESNSSKWGFSYPNQAGCY